MRLHTRWCSNWNAGIINWNNEYLYVYYNM